MKPIMRGGLGNVILECKMKDIVFLSHVLNVCGNIFSGLFIPNNKNFISSAFLLLKTTTGRCSSRVLYLLTLYYSHVGGVRTSNAFI